MKKLLLATTMLVGTAGFAAAEVTLSGDARMGIINNGDQTEFTSRARVAFGLSGETDGGLSFGASFRADNSEAASKGDAGSVFISGAFGKISMGDVDSADKAAVGQISGVGMTGLGDSNELEYSADGLGLFGVLGDGGLHPAISVSSKVLYSYTADAISVYASLSQIAHDEDEDADSFALGASYTAGDLTLAAGYGKTNAAGHGEDADVTDISASAAYVLGATTLKGIYQHKSLDVNGGELGHADSYGLSVDHTMDALTLTAFAIQSNINGDGDDLGTLHRYGVGAAYSLGGGASIVGGVARADTADWSNDEIDTTTQYDLGLTFSF
jgi:outer membrane protein OmpU